MTCGLRTPDGVEPFAEESSLTLRHKFGATFNALVLRI
jgi:hypothetical protein